MTSNWNDPEGVTIDAYLAALASAASTPGGGSAVALVGALSAALVAMVARLTVGKPAFVDVEASAQRLTQMADTSRDALVHAMADDEAAFATVIAAYRRPRDTAAARAERRDAIAAASRAAALPPLAAAREARAIIDLAADAAAFGNPAVISDAVVAAWLAYAVIRASAANVRANFAAANDPAFVDACTSELDRLIADAHRCALDVESAAAGRR